MFYDPLIGMKSFLHRGNLNVVSEGNSTGVCGAWIGGSNMLFDGRQRLTKLLSWLGNLDEGQSAINCEMVAAFVMLYIMKHCVVGGMDIQVFPDHSN